MIERWKAISEYGGSYEVSNLGNVKSFKTRNPRLMTPNRRHNPKNRPKPYLAVCLTKEDGKKVTHYVHLLVWWTFVGEIPEGHEIFWINDDTSDNRVFNLGCRPIT